MTNETSYTKVGYKLEKWKWVLKLDIPFSNSEQNGVDVNIDRFIKKEHIVQTYGINKVPKILPCRKKCTRSPWCLTDITVEEKSAKAPLTEKQRETGYPVGLQNTSNTCWINSALQALFHIAQFRNVINSLIKFNGEESLLSLPYLLQATFVEMDLHTSMALACSNGNMFEKLAVFATQKIMQKDQDFEVLKCVSEFLENTIDTLLVEPFIGEKFSPIFKTSLMRVARWTCSNCNAKHTTELAPDSCYTMAAYVSGDECPLNQCILDLQEETQTGVSMKCTEENCRTVVNVNRVVTPKVLSLPSLLIIRNNSLVDRVSKRRQHVVYPEVLDISNHTYLKDEAKYALRAVIFHHGYWMKHFSAHVKTEWGDWYSFNDEKVVPLVKQTGNSIPLESHRNYFSLANVASKYKNRKDVRVSRGAFIWIYERVASSAESIIPPPVAVLNFISARNSRDDTKDREVLEEVRQKRKHLLKGLSVSYPSEDCVVVSKEILRAWLESDQLNYVPQPSLLARGLCEHKKFNPKDCPEIKCISRLQFNKMLLDECGIHSDDKHLPFGLSLEEAFCRECIAKHAAHIMFREKLKELYKRVKKQALKTPADAEYQFIGAITFAMWPKFAAITYLKIHGLEEDSVADAELYKQNSDVDVASTEESENERCPEDTVAKDSPESIDVPMEFTDEYTDTIVRDDDKCNSELKRTDSSRLKSDCSDTIYDGDDIKNRKIEAQHLFNQDVVCSHDLRNPKSPGFWIPKSIMSELLELCKEFLHPATLSENFRICEQCQTLYDMMLQVCGRGKLEKKRLYQFSLDRRRPNIYKDVSRKIFIVSRIFYQEWKEYTKMCEKNHFDSLPPASIDNSEFVCRHGCLGLSPQMLTFPKVSETLLFLSEEEMEILLEYYPCSQKISAVIVQSGILELNWPTCSEGCVAEREKKMYEEQFDYEFGLIHIKQVNSISDIPVCVIDENSQEVEPRKKRRILNGPKCVSSPLRPTQRLARFSKHFGSQETMRAVQHFIGQRTTYYPMLQTIWLVNSQEYGNEPLQLTEEHYSMTLSSLRVRPEDTIYFMANPEDISRASGAELSEFLEEEQEA